MAKNTGAMIGTGVGALGGMFMGNPLLGASLGGSLGSMFDGGGGDDEIKDMRTEEQKRAAKALMQLGETGTFDNITLGELYGGNMGAYDTSGYGKAINRIEGLMNNNDVQTARNTLSRLTNLEFNPDDPSSGYAAFQRQLARAGKDASSVIDREAAITGNRFGTAIAGEKADLAERLTDQSAGYLANLYNTQQDRALRASGGLMDLVGQQSNLIQQAAQNEAAINAVKDQEARDKYTEFKRARTEDLSRIDLLQTEANRNPYLGVSSLPGSPSPFSSLANSVLGSMGKQIGSDIGSGGLSSLFSFGNKNSSYTPTSGSGSTLVNSAKSYGAGSSGFGGGSGGFNFSSMVA